MARQHLLIIVAGLFGLAASPGGKELYTQHCASCHGPQGKGDGSAAVYIFPKPRDFTRGTFKIRSTPDGELPTDEDLFNTLTRGMPGSAMPSFAFLSEADRRALVAHVKTLVTKPQDAPAKPIAVGKEPPHTPGSIAEGKKLYAQMQCAKCHGETGKGDGPSAAALKDSWDYPIKVRDFTTGIYLGGPTDRDLYLRFTTGMSGTPMPSYQESLNDDQRWALVQYVQSLRVPHEQFTAPKDNLIIAKRVRGSIDLAKTPDYQIPVMVLWPCPPRHGVSGLHGIHVRAAHNGKQLAISLEWDAPEPSHANVGMKQFRDSAGIQFSMTGQYTFLGMGDKDNPVNVWHWKSDWQAEVDGKRIDVADEHQNMHVDYYDRAEPIFITARAAGNLFAAEKRTTPVEDLNATGFGTLEAQPAAEQNVTGKGEWKNGQWRVLFVRDLTTKEAGDQQFKPGATVPVSFAVWAGEHGDRDGQKAVSTWFNLKLER
jgi:mono/diheme cytochrome c family protein